MDNYIKIMETIFLVIIGSIFGSFFNCIIPRIKRHKNWIIKPSYCEQCGKTLKWYHMIPLISYILFRGKCQYCKAKIPASCFMMEAIFALSFGTGYLYLTVDGIFQYWLPVSILCLASVFDIHYKEIPWLCTLTCVPIQVGYWISKCIITSDWHYLIPIIFGVMMFIGLFVYSGARVGAVGGQDIIGYTILCLSINYGTIAVTLLFTAVLGVIVLALPLKKIVPEMFEGNAVVMFPIMVVGINISALLSKIFLIGGLYLC